MQVWPYEALTILLQLFSFSFFDFLFAPSFSMEKKGLKFELY